MKKDIIGGFDLGRDYPELKNHVLIAVTELRTKEEIDALVQEMGAIQCITKTKHLIFEITKEGRVGYSLPEFDVPEVDLASIYS